MQKLRVLWCLIALVGLAACGSEASDEKAAAPVTTTADREASEPAIGAPAPSTSTAPTSAGSVGSAATPPPSASSPGASSGPSSASKATSSSGAAGASAPASAAPIAPGASAAAPPPSDPSDRDDGATPPPPTQSGTLTAGVWDDNRNFDRFVDYRAKQKKTGRQGIIPLSDEEHAEAHEHFTGAPKARTTLDVSLVIDTTGSMQDEISYLQTEFLALSRAIETEYPDASQRWSLVAYRDQGDTYVTRVFDFTDDVQDFRSKLAEQQADGGGDFPEAPDAALAAMAELDWRDGDANSRLAFWVADAPHHDANAAAMAEALRDARGLDVHVYPVASSGIDEFTELAMRSAAQFTGGRYVFLTNDSGVGGDHKEPSIPCYFVTRLDQAILRMVRIELSAMYSEPRSEEIIRRSGNPQSGACQLESGGEVTVF